jgi:GNAT superfamily N-acetyltransferase
MAAVVSAAFGIPPEIQERTERALCTEFSGPEWHIYLATLDGAPASMAAVHVRDSVASIDAMGTVPDFRRRGCQRALLAHCMDEAACLGCDLIASQTRPSSTSEKNMARAGLRIAYTKILYSERDISE